MTILFLRFHSLCSSFIAPVQYEIHLSDHKISQSLLVDLIVPESSQRSTPVENPLNGASLTHSMLVDTDIIVNSSSKEIVQNSSILKKVALETSADDAEKLISNTLNTSTNATKDSILIPLSTKGYDKHHSHLNLSDLVHILKESHHLHPSHREPSSPVMSLPTTSDSPNIINSEIKHREKISSKASNTKLRSSLPPPLSQNGHDESQSQHISKKISNFNVVADGKTIIKNLGNNTFTKHPSRFKDIAVKLIKDSDEKIRGTTETMMKPMMAMIPKEKAGVILKPMKSMIPKFRHLTRANSVDDPTPCGSVFELETRPVTNVEHKNIPISIRETDIEVEFKPQVTIALPSNVLLKSNHMYHDNSTQTNNNTTKTNNIAKENNYTDATQETSRNMNNYPIATVTPLPPVVSKENSPIQSEHESILEKEREVLVKMLQGNNATSNSFQTPIGASSMPYESRDQPGLPISQLDATTQILESPATFSPTHLQPTISKAWNSSPRRGPSVENLDASFSNISDYYLNVLFEDPMINHSSLPTYVGPNSVNQSSPYTGLIPEFDRLSSSYPIAPTISLGQDLAGYYQTNCYSSAPNVLKQPFDVENLQYLDLYDPGFQSIYGVPTRINPSDVLSLLIAKQNEFLKSGMNEIFRKSHPQELPDYINEKQLDDLSINRDSDQNLRGIQNINIKSSSLSNAKENVCQSSPSIASTEQTPQPSNNAGWNGNTHFPFPYGRPPVPTVNNIRGWYNPMNF